MNPKMTVGSIASMILQVLSGMEFWYTGGLLSIFRFAAVGKLHKHRYLWQHS
jgi:hypothetical protein